MPNSQPLLWQFLPEEGFQWLTNAGTPLLRSSQAREVVRAMKKTGRRLDKSACMDYIVLLFSAAKEKVQLCQYLNGPGFWEIVSGHVKWAQGVSPANLYDLSLRIISARRIFLDRVDCWAEMKREEHWDVPDSYLIRVFNEANAAVDGFTDAVCHTYETNSKIRERFYPKWADDSDNEGTAEATKARFYEKCLETRDPSYHATVNGQSTIHEGEDMKMDEDVEMSEGMDEDMGNDASEMDHEVDEEMGEGDDEVDEAGKEMQMMGISEGEPSHTMTLTLRFR
ncbi:hypothetical protein K445DRAFT_10200 [Daldinia sp. EC12]|nr:hypothetical protein K445DRAFT_10200 [Daldinia sp. EC12]